MQFENWITRISSYLPGYTTRIYLLFCFLLFVTLSTLIFLKRKKLKKSVKRKFQFSLPLILGVFFLSLSVLSYFFLQDFLKKIFSDNIIYILLPTAIFSLTSFSKNILRTLKKKKIEKIVYISEISLYSLLFLAILIISLFSVPHISVKTNSNSERLEDSQEITLLFTSPLKKSDLKINISPETKIAIEYDYFLNINSLVESVKIIPLESFLPNQKIVIYTTGIQRIFPLALKHENSQEFFTPKTPEVEQVVLGSDIQNVSITEPITLDLDTKDQKFIQWDVIFTPETEYDIERNSTESVVIRPLKLKQGTEYKLQIYMSVIRYNPVTLKKISTESEELVEEISFTTAPAPGVKSFNRSEGFISNSEPLIVSFDKAIKEESLEGKFSIQPEVEGILSLSDDETQLIFKPTTTFEKDTEYTATLSAGIENIYDGYIEKDIILKFQTPGSVSLLYSSPRNYSTNISNTTKSIGLTFNQPVDKTSVQERFSISPNISGSFSWNGNTMYYSFANSLAHGTKYTVTLKTGINALYGLDSTKNLYISFTTKYQTFLLNVPLYYQGESFTCNLAATRMVLAYKGISSSESGIRDSLGVGLNPATSWVDKYGVHWGPISSYISSRGVINSIKSGMSLTSALEEVRNGHPILLYLYNGYTQPRGAFTLEGGFTGYKGMHSEILVGYIGTPQNPQTIITNDPWRGKRYYYPSTFKGLWSYLGYLGIVIY